MKSSDTVSITDVRAVIDRLIEARQMILLRATAGSPAHYVELGKIEILEYLLGLYIFSEKP